MTTAEENRARLLNMAQGGNGQTADYIERVTLDDAPEDKRTAYILHSPAKTYPDGKRSKAGEFLGTWEHAAALYMLPYMDGEQHPREDSIPIADDGRHIPPAEWQKRWEVLSTFDA